MFILIVCVAIKTVPTEAATYEVFLMTGGQVYTQNSSAIVEGFNKTHGFSKRLEYSFRRSDNNTYINYTLPDDGSVWEIDGVAFIFLGGSTDTLYTSRFRETKTTSGTFTGVSISQAVNAANSAKSSADSAKTDANESKNMLNGSSNGGKSLAATYDKANSANSNTTYIRML